MPTEDISRILDVEIPVIVNITRQEMTLEELLSLRAGDTITLKKQVSETFDLIVNERAVAHGKIVKSNLGLGFELTSIAKKEDIVKLLGE
ncbi:MAG: FliM/FliN family flagellar motor switch protein [Planctomycetes bacterium]|nr:FliM/FliN family flagellar motor switch protein [Planctomycetota bacterium]